MERTHVKSSAFLLIVLIFGFATENSYAKFGKCYGKCVLKCTFHHLSPVTCAAKCVPKCFFHHDDPTNLIEEEAHHCTLRCTTSKCTTTHSQDIEDVENCANDCLENCIMYTEELINGLTP